MMMVTSQGLFPTGKNSPSLTQQRDNGYSSTHRKQPAIISWLRSDDLAIFRLQSNWLVEKTFKGKNTLPAPMQPPTKADTKQKEKTGPGSANLPTKGWMRTTLKSHVLDWRLSLTYWSKNRKYINIRITRGATPLRDQPVETNHLHNLLEFPLPPAVTTRGCCPCMPMTVSRQRPIFSFKLSYENGHSWYSCHSSTSKHHETLKITGWWYTYPLWKIWISWEYSYQCMGKKHVPNHQSENHHVTMPFRTLESSPSRWSPSNAAEEGNTG